MPGKTEFRLAFRRPVAADDKVAGDCGGTRAAVSALKRLQAKAGHDREGFAPCSANESRLRPAFGRRPTASYPVDQGGRSDRRNCQGRPRTRVRGNNDWRQALPSNSAARRRFQSRCGERSQKLTSPSARHRWSGASRDSAPRAAKAVNLKVGSALSGSVVAFGPRSREGASGRWRAAGLSRGLIALLGRACG